VKTDAESAKDFKARRVDGDVGVGLCVFAVLVFVPFVCCCAIDGYRANAEGVWVAAGNIDEVVGYVLAAKGDDIESEVRFSRYGKAFNSLFDVGKESCFLADGCHHVSKGVVDVVGACASAACDCMEEARADDLPAGVAVGEFAA
jgi:hypothetical protein